MPWWLENNLRLIQTNLRDIDADLDTNILVNELKDYECNTLMVNAGGITSFFPSKLEYQVPSPYLNSRDTLGEIVEKCKAAGIRVIGRFDFSKTHEKFYDLHPEWYYRSANGQIVRYNDTVHTCINGFYQQEYALDIIGEVLEKYPLDGIFFNYFGFVTRDYNNNYYGICHCDSCRKRFYEYAGTELPSNESFDDPSYSKYLEFKEYVIHDIMDRIHKLVRGFSPEIAICTYHHKFVDIIRNESNSAVDRPYPFWIYNSSANVAKVRSDWDDKIISNCVINAVDIFYRHMGVSKELTRIRLYENIAEGSGLDFCIIGVFANYHDRANLPFVKEVYHFHKKNEKYFGHLQSQARVAVIQPTGITPVIGGSKNYMGIFKALKESHIPFDVLGTEKVLSSQDTLKHYSLVLFPDLTGITSKVIEAVKNQDVRMILAGVTDVAHSGMTDCLGLKVSSTLKATRSAYLNTQEKGIFKHFPDRDWIIFDKDLGILEAPLYQNLLPLMSTAWYGPPERAFGHKDTPYGGAYLDQDKKYACIPWNIGELYYQYGYEDFKFILTDLMDHIAPDVRVLETDAPSCVEVFWNRCKNGEYLLQLINLSGFNGTTVTAHIPISGITVKLPLSRIKKAASLTGGQCTIQEKNGVTELVIHRLEQYEAVALTSSDA